MATWNKFNIFTSDLLNQYHNFGTHTFKLLLTNSAPTAANAIKADLTDISAGNGYSAGGPASAVTVSTASGVAKATFTDTVVTASGGTIGPFRYVGIYNDTQTVPAKPLVAWLDYGTSITLNATETFTVDFDGTNGAFTIT